MLLSIVSGTYNRLSHLQRMMDSARRQLPSSLAYEFVIVDGGSTDGTLDWLRDQRDTRVIAHGELRGALRAFTDGARAAKGDYVLLANDDVEFEGDGIVRAITHLEKTFTCGAVAFADDRPALGYAPGYKVQVMDACSPDGQSVAVAYAQVGLFRRSLGELVGWWGADDPVMGRGRTYGGDNFLSAGIWERGYTVDAVSGVRVKDTVIPDALRAHNVERDVAIGNVYGQRYPRGPVIGSLPKPLPPQPARMRILYLPLYEPGYGQYKWGLRDALRRVGLVYELDYLAAPVNLARVVDTWQPHLVLTQFHSADPIGADAIAQARRFCPSSVWVNWNGDVYKEALTAPPYIDLLKQMDIQLVVNADVIPFYAERGIASAYWQIGFEPVHYYPDTAAHDVVFQGNAYSDVRKEFGRVLTALPYDIGLYGRGWERASGETLYAFDRAGALCRNAKITVGDNQYGDAGFVSNRLFETLGHGGFLLHQHVPELEALTGLVSGLHYVAFTDLDDMRQKIAYYLDPAHETERERIRRDGQAFVQSRHSFDARVHELFTTLLPVLSGDDLNVRSESHL